MSTSARIWRIARRRVMQGLGLVQGAGFRNSRDTAARDEIEELEEYLRRPTQPPAADPPRASPQPHPYLREYRILGAPPGSDLPTVQRCWRRLVRETHPDRFTSDPIEQQRAADRLRKANVAYDRLRRYLGGS